MTLSIFSNTLIDGVLRRLLQAEIEKYLGAQGYPPQPPQQQAPWAPQQPQQQYPPGWDPNKDVPF